MKAPLGLYSDGYVGSCSGFFGCVVKNQVQGGISLDICEEL